MRDGDYSYPGMQLTISNVTEDRIYRRYFRANFLKLLRTSILPEGQLRTANC